MNATVRLYINDVPVDVPAESSVAAAVLQVVPHCRRSLGGQPRAPLCGMGVCFECRVKIDGEAHVRACMTPVRQGMRVCTDV